MTGAGVARGWARCYTAGLPADVRDRRRAEIESDVHEHLADGGVGVAVVGRTLRGIGADLFWRLGERRAMTNRTGIGAAWAAATHTWFAPAAVLMAVYDLGLGVWVITDTDGKMPGRVVGPAVMAALAASLLVGLWLRWRSTSEQRSSARVEPRPTMRMGLWLVAAVAVVAVVAGGMASLFVMLAGVLALAGVAALGRRPGDSDRAERVMLADVLIVLGTLPGLGVWWMIVPPVLALIVIVGVIGTGPGTRRRAREAF